RLAAGDQVAVAHDLGVAVFRPGVDHVILDGEEASGLLSFEGLGRAEYGRTVTDGGHNLALFGHVADEADDGFGTPQEVRREAAGNNDDVEIVGLHILSRFIRFGRVAELARILFARFRSHQGYLATGLAETINRIPH